MCSFPFVLSAAIKQIFSGIEIHETFQFTLQEDLVSVKGPLRVR